MITFKEQRLKAEFLSDAVCHDIRLLVLVFAVYVEARWGKDIVVTSVLPELGIKRKSNTHEQGRAVDIRTRDWTEEMITDSRDWLNSRFATGAFFRDGPPMKVAIYHDSGHGPHFHLQVARRPLQILTTNNDKIVI